MAPSPFEDGGSGVIIITCVPNLVPRAMPGHRGHWHAESLGRIKMDDSLKNLNEKLDEFLLLFFEKLEVLEDVREKLTNSMRNGFLSMSKARYSMGNKAVGEMQYARNMTASTMVFERENGSSKDGESHLLAGVEGFEVLFDANESKTEINESLINNEKPGLRQRTHKGTTKDLEESKTQTKFSSSKRKSIDPLKWFGVLVPGSLKDCQREFKNACSLVCEVTRLEQELEKIMEDYEKLKNEKRIVQSSDENKND